MNAPVYTYCISGLTGCRCSLNTPPGAGCSGASFQGNTMKLKKMKVKCMGCDHTKTIEGKDIPTGNDPPLCEKCGMPMEPISVEAS